MLMFLLGFVVGPVGVLFFICVWESVVEPIKAVFRMKDDLRQLEKDFRRLRNVAKTRKLRPGEMIEA